MLLWPYLLALLIFAIIMYSIAIAIARSGDKKNGEPIDGHHSHH